ncbi:glycerophosphodiester phosphodiesterase [Anaeromicrobium sediminis]|uniref:GP-PDE domain-containing protein n=1 Tax=Anaeromicrobium sediminis TaxID=1478221 RepID=A0A267MFU8_9FIRM|nr:glycerophosphodiester phosphodiesterase family protein [Anaeromicrobium sediminis]PAB58451.1 hypothetical protein CCE28_15190 [Anaeromicrobium sediminis]
MNKIIAHRGWSSRAPENTISSIKLALEEERIDMIEIDIHLTKDDVVVVSHDFVLGRTSNGKGRISDYTYEELMQFDFGAWFSEKYNGEKIPTLEKVLNIIDGKKTLIVEIKKDNRNYPNMAEQLCKLLKDYKHKDKVLIKSFNHEVIKDIHHMDDEINIGMLIDGMPNLVLEKVRKLNGSFVSMSFEYIDRELVKQLIKNNIQVMVWTVNEKEDIHRIKEISDRIGIITNYPEKAF